MNIYPFDLSLCGNLGHRSQKMVLGALLSGVETLIHSLAQRY